jgi:hypothetical protein
MSQQARHTPTKEAPHALDMCSCFPRRRAALSFDRHMQRLARGRYPAQHRRLPQQPHDLPAGFISPLIEQPVWRIVILLQAIVRLLQTQWESVIEQLGAHQRLHVV